MTGVLGQPHEFVTVDTVVQPGTKQVLQAETVAVMMGQFRGGSVTTGGGLLELVVFVLVVLLDDDGAHGLRPWQVV